MKTGNKILISVAIVALVGLVCFYFYFPIYLIGPIMPLHFSLHNYDGVNKHNIKIEIFDLNNKSIFKEIYNLGPNEEISSPEITKKKGEYTFNVILDDKITQTFKVNVDYGQGNALIELYKNDSISEKKVPIVVHLPMV
ncbi:MAG: hypothetical protein ACNYWM_05100 [Methanosarcinales archaeon]